MSAPIIAVVWQGKKGHAVLVVRGKRIVWQRRAGLSRKRLRGYLEKAAIYRQRLIAQA
jgi:hypothetical protein